MKQVTSIQPAEVFVTTKHAPNRDDEKTARELSVRLGCRFAPRKSHSISRLSQRMGVAAALVAGKEDAYLVFQGKRYGFHPNMALQRLTALKQGCRDRLAEAALLKSGDRFLDCTCGLGADAIIAAHMVGVRGQVKSLEKSALLATVIESGLRYYQHKDTALVRAMRLVKVEHRRYQELFPMLDTGSWDVVYFDPMFDEGFEDSGNLELVRLLGDSGLPDAESLREAKRVARRCVVVKDREPGILLEQLGIPVVSDSKRVWYGRLDVKRSTFA